MIFFMNTGRSRAGVVFINSGNAMLTSSLIRWDSQGFLEVNNVMRGLYIVGTKSILIEISQFNLIINIEDFEFRLLVLE